jgi:hypothetical protein
MGFFAATLVGTYKSILVHCPFTTTDQQLDEIQLDENGIAATAGDRIVLLIPIYTSRCKPWDGDQSIDRSSEQLRVASCCKVKVSQI